MKILKIILGALAVILIAPFVIALFTAKDYHVEREILINQSKERVFDYVKYLNNQENYSKWSSMDPNQKYFYTGKDGMPGYVSRWEGNDDVGVGEQEIKAVTEGERIDYELRFIQPFESTSDAYITTEAIDENTTLVKWGFVGRMGYPLNAMLLFMDMESMIGDDLEFGLNQLKLILEK